MMVWENISMPHPLLASAPATPLPHHASHTPRQFPVTFGLNIFTYSFTRTRSDQSDGFCASL